MAAASGRRDPKVKQESRDVITADHDRDRAGVKTNVISGSFLRGTRSRISS
jgi:hypothetical protein